jgi:hypothetical protein
MEGIYEMHHLDRLRWYVIHTKFYEDRFRHLSNITVITATIWVALMLVSLIEEIYEARRWDGLRWHDVHTKFQAILGICLRNLEVVMLVYRLDIVVEVHY